MTQSEKQYYQESVSVRKLMDADRYEEALLCWRRAIRLRLSKESRAICHASIAQCIMFLHGGKVRDNLALRKARIAWFKAINYAPSELVLRTSCAWFLLCYYGDLANAKEVLRNRADYHLTYRFEHFNCVRLHLLAFVELAMGEMGKFRRLVKAFRNSPLTQKEKKRILIRTKSLVLHHPFNGLDRQALNYLWSWG